MVQSAQINSNGTTAAVQLGPFEGGLHNSSGVGEFIEDKELFSLVNLEVDTDKSLVNRPAIRNLPVAGSIASDVPRLIGNYLPPDGRKFLVVYCTNAGVVRLVDPATGAVAASSSAMKSVCSIQFQNRLYVIPSHDSGGDGGYFDASSPTVTWTAIPAIPKGESAVVYKQRLWVAAGIGASTASSVVRCSDIINGDVWPGANAVNVDAGNGEKLVYMVVLFNDIVFFKQHSTYRFGYSSDPLKGELSKISDKIGCPAINCAVTYDNNNVFVMHDNSVYELYNYNYNRISTNVALTQEFDPSIYPLDTYGLTIYRDRLFVRYYKNLYVYSLKTKRWSSWITDRKFSRIVSIPSSDVGLDTAYAATATVDLAGRLFYFRDSKIEGVGVEPGGEIFECSLQTKTHDFGVPHAYKVCMFWGLTIATSGDTTGRLVIPNASRNYTWNFMKANYTWDSAKLAGIKWSNNATVIYPTVRSPELGLYAKKFLKMQKKVRFRQAYITITTQAKANTVADACVRIFDITVFVTPKQLVSKATT